MISEPVILSRIYSETVNQLDSLAQRVCEGRDIEAASNFARWLSFSGIIKLLEDYPPGMESFGPKTVDGALLRWKCDQLIQACSERFRTNSLDPAFEKKKFESLHEKIDSIAGYLSKLTAARTINVEPASQHHLQTSEPINEPVIHLPAGDADAVQIESTQPETFTVIQGGLAK